MDPLAKRTLGKSGVALSQMGMGGASLGDLFNKVPDDDAHATLAAAWDEGIRYFDTAPWYGRGQSEHRFGRFLYSRERSQFILSTKVGRILKAPHDPSTFQSGFWTGGLQFDHVFDYSYDAIMRAFEDSLQRLGMNRIDLLIIHDLDFWHHASEPKVAAYLAQLSTGGFRALEELRTAGVIKAIGAGINELGMMPRFLDLFDVDFFLCALRYSLMEHDVLDAEFPYCQRREVGIVVGGAFSSGITATGPMPGAKYNYADATPEIISKVRRIQEVCTAPRRAAAGGRAAIPTGPSDCGIGHPGGLPAGPRRPEHAAHAPPDPHRSLGRAQAREADPRRRARAGGLKAVAKITKVVLTSFRYEVEGLSLPAHGAAGVGNLVARQGGRMPATRWASPDHLRRWLRRRLCHPLGRHGFVVRAGADARTPSDRPRPGHPRADLGRSEARGARL